MSKIAKRPQITAETFMQGAPDAAPEPAPHPQKLPAKRDRKQKISHTIPEDMLVRLDEKAAQLGQSRAGFINLAIAKLLEG